MGKWWPEIACSSSEWPLKRSRGPPHFCPSQSLFGPLLELKEASARQTNSLAIHLLTFFSIIFSFFLPAHPAPPQAISASKRPLFLGPQNYSLQLRKENLQGLGFGEGSGRGRRRGKNKRNFLKKWRAKKGESL